MYDGTLFIELYEWFSNKVIYMGEDFCCIFLIVNSSNL